MRRAFTIVELIVSILLVLVLMLGVSTVFKTISGTVSAGSAISDGTRVARGAQAILAQDFNSCVTRDAPCMILHSEARPAFRNMPDMLGDRDYTATAGQAARDSAVQTTDLNGDNTEGGGGEIAVAARPNSRMHRIDSFSFFTRGLFKRQTGGSVASSGAQPFIADQSSTEAWVWYGHLRIANNAGTVLAAQDPGAGTFGDNNNNFFATQWVLGREAIVLRESENGDIKDRAGVAQIYIDGTGALSPLSYGTKDSLGSFTIQQSRFDLADTSISSYRQKLLAYLNNPANLGNPWWQTIFGSGGRRFQANPVLTRPVTSASVSQQAPIFVPGCTQFVVEYAGDFVHQLNDPALPTYGNVDGWYGAATGPTTDGVIDYVIANGTKQIRWYGAPRDANGDGFCPGWTAGRLNNAMPDVVPLRDVIRSIPGLQTSNGAPFEKNMAVKMPTPTGTVTIGPNTSTADYAAPTGGFGIAGEYECAWTPSDPKPKLIRITLVVDDPAGRNPNPDGQVFEFTFELQ